MGQVIPFQGKARRRAPARTSSGGLGPSGLDERDLGEADLGEAEILFFLGVRYCRREDQESGGGRDNDGGARRADARTARGAAASGPEVPQDGGFSTLH